MRAVAFCAAAVLAALAAACTPGPNYSPRDWVSLPPDAVVGAGDPTRSAILNTAYAFGTPASLAGRPAEAAVAGAQLDYPRQRDPLRAALARIRPDRRAAAAAGAGGGARLSRRLAGRGAAGGDRLALHRVPRAARE